MQRGTEKENKGEKENGIILYSLPEAWWGPDISNAGQIFSPGILAYMSKQLYWPPH